MKAKLIIDGQELEIMLSEQDAKNLGYVPKKNGYERSEYNKTYFTEGCGYIQSYADWGKDIDEAYYKCANYYSDKTVAENNVRADNLMRKLRRFSVEHRTKDNPDEVFYIYYIRGANLLQLRRDRTDRFIGPWFDSQHAGAQAIETFKDELIWYFTEYKDSL
jgi:hypothetical protein